MRQPLQVFGMIGIAAFMLLRAGALNAWLVYDLGLRGIHPAVLPVVLGVFLFLALRELRSFQDMAGVASLLVAWQVTVIFWNPLNQWMYQRIGPSSWPWVAPLCLFLITLYVVQTLARAVLPPFPLNGGGLSTFPARRRFVALNVNACLTIGLIVGFMALRDWFTATIPDGQGRLDPTHELADFLGALHQILFVKGPGAYPTVNYVAAGIIFFVVWSSCLRPAKSVLGVVLAPVQRFSDASRSGVGGSSRFLGYVEEWRMVWRPGRLPLGRSTYDGTLLGRKDDRHALICAATRSGKNLAFVSRLLLTWLGSAFVIDPKGENAAITARIRKVKLRQMVHILDPFSVLKKGLKLPEHWWLAMGEGGQPYRPARYNPLADIDPASPNAVDLIRNLVAAFVISDPEAHTDKFWVEAPRFILEGVVAHVLVTDEVANNERHLGTVQDYVACINGRSLWNLDRPIPAGKPDVGQLALKAFNTIKEASDRAGPDILLSLRVHLKWLDSGNLREHMSASDFSMRGLKYARTSVYLVLPDDKIKDYPLYLRVLLSMGLREANTGHKGQHSMLFLLDEFAALGRLDCASTAAGTSAGPGVMMVPVVQTIVQLQNLYKEDWQVFLSSASQQIIFGTNDAATVAYYTAKLGNHLAWNFNEQTKEYQAFNIQNLRTEGEITRESSRASGQALVYFEGAETAIVRRAPYNTWFGSYDPNPYEPYGFKVWARAGVAWLLRYLSPRNLWRTGRAIHFRLNSRNAY